MFWWLFWKKEEDKVKLLDKSFFDLSWNKVKLKDNWKIDLNKIIIVKFSTESCPACQMFRYPLKEFELKNKENITSFEVNLTEEEELSQNLRIMSVPTNFIFVKWELYDISVWANLWEIVQKIKPLWIKIK